MSLKYSHHKLCTTLHELCQQKCISVFTLQLCNMQCVGVGVSSVIQIVCKYNSLMFWLAQIRHPVHNQRWGRAFRWHVDRKVFRKLAACIPPPPPFKSIQLGWYLCTSHLCPPPPSLSIYEVPFHLPPPSFSMKYPSLSLLPSP